MSPQTKISRDRYCIFDLYLIQMNSDMRMQWVKYPKETRLTFHLQLVSLWRGDHKKTMSELKPIPLVNCPNKVLKFVRSLQPHFCLVIPLTHQLYGHLCSDTCMPAGVNSLHSSRHHPGQRAISEQKGHLKCFHESVDKQTSFYRMASKTAPSLLFMFYYFQLFSQFHYNRITNTGSTCF